MSNGINAIKGFEYQATVILDRLFDHFDRNRPTARVRPEGIEDLDLYWTEGAIERRHYLQIKKPREDNDGHLKPRAWTLSEAVTELLPNTIRNLRGNQFEQTWLIGDAVSDELRSLLDGGVDAPIAAAEAYWTAVHLLVRNEIIDGETLDTPQRNKLLRWRPTVDHQAQPADVLSAMTEAFRQEVANIGASSAMSDRYRGKVAELHHCLPEILARTRVLPAYGTEREVALRIQDRLQQQYGLQRSVIENALFRNLRGFIVDISKQPGRAFDNTEFELELRNIWPHMVPIKDVPSPGENHIPRPDLSDRFTTRWAGTAIEAVGISGSGKTMLTAEVAEKSRASDPERLVYYAEVRPNATLRDVLVGLSFHLHRWGLPALFAESVEVGPADNDVLATLAKRYASLTQSILLLVDLVEGSSDDAFAHDLSTFVRSLLPSSALRVAVFGQESAFRALSGLEKEQHGVAQVDIRGFRFEEFVALVTQYHPNPDRSALSDIYTRVTAGREAGLFARLAHSIASAPSMAEMAAIAAKPAEEMVSYAERVRFARVTSNARSAAEKLVCFALPFQRKDAEEVFPDDNVGAALQELSTLGLLRPHDIASFEMHEIVRAGLEEGIAVNVRRAAHQALAAWYASRGLVTAEILHLEKAGDQAGAHARAREVFLLGKHWAALTPYVMEHKLVSADEVLRRIASTDSVEDCYVVPGLLRALGSGQEADQLISILRAQPERFATDYQWGLAIVEAALERDPARLPELISFAVEEIADPNRRQAALSWLMITVRRKDVQIGSPIVTMFNVASPEVKQHILPFLLRSRRRDALRPALNFMANATDLPSGRGRPRSWNEPSLRIDDYQDTVEFLAALPDVDYGGMAITKSPLLGSLGGLIWARRKELQAHCLQALKDATAEEKVLEGAIRVLVFLGELLVWEHCEPLLKRQDRVGRLARLVPAMLPGVCDRALYEARVLDAKLILNDRAAAVQVLAFAGADLGSLLRRVVNDKENAENLDKLGGLFLLACTQTPFADAVPLLDKLMSASDPAAIPIITAVLSKLAELPDLRVTGLLARALSNPSREIRLCAAVSLSQRRSRAALSSLRAQFAVEEDGSLMASQASAIVASGPTSVADLPSARLDTLATRLWRCILATRLRDASIADEVVAMAADPTQNWQVRRAAIFAAGRMPYEAALEKIVPAIMQEQFSLTLDKSPNLQCHEAVSSMVLCDVQSLLQIFLRGRDGFVDFFGEIFEGQLQQSMFREGLPSGAELAGWVFDRLHRYGWPTKGDAPDRLLNELHIPMLQGAVLRSLRMAGRPEQIEAQLPSAPYVWLATKCVQERRRAGQRDPQLKSRLKGLIALSPVRDAPFLQRILAEIPDSDVAPPVATPALGTATGDAKPPAIKLLTYDEAALILSDPSSTFNHSGPVVVEAADREQFERLVKLADPTNDHYPSVEAFVPGVSFTPNGHIVARRTVTSKGGEAPAALVRPAIAAANRFRIQIPWHEELLNSVHAGTYIPRLFASLDAQNESGRFYEELEAHADPLLPRLCNAALPAPVTKYVDGRIVPLLLRHISSGTDELFETLCALVLLVDTPEIDPVLSGLLYRFVQHFDLRSPLMQHNENFLLWRGFKQLARHPRFELISGWQSRLAPVLQAQLYWIHAEDVVRVLERSPRSYTLIEARLFRATNWHHFPQDEIDRLDAAAERLFPRLLEEATCQPLERSKRGAAGTAACIFGCLRAVASHALQTIPSHIKRLLWRRSC